MLITKGEDKAHWERLIISSFMDFGIKENKLLNKRGKREWDKEIISYINRESPHS